MADRRFYMWTVLMSAFFTPLAWASPTLVVDFRAMYWAASCVTCHGADKAIKDSSIPRLAGVPAAEIESTMKAYASGERPGLLMQQLSKGYDAATIRSIAQWYESLPKETP